MPPRQRPLIRRVVLALALCVCAAGCRKPLLDPDEDRSQFDRYRTIRETREPSYLRDEFGRQVPNLRGRLLEEG